MTYIITATLDARRRARHGSTGPVQLTDPLTARERRQHAEHALRGHTALEPGLRGHSVDPVVHPWLVVGGHAPTAAGLVNTWDVYGQDGLRYGRFYYAPGTPGQEAVQKAHGLARSLKLQYPEGRAEEDRNYSGTPAEFLQRCRGHFLTLRRHGRERVRGVLGATKYPAMARIITEQGAVTFSLALAANPEAYPLFEVEYNPNAW